MPNLQGFALASARRFAAAALAAILIALLGSSCAWVPLRRGPKIVHALPSEGVAYAEPMPDSTAADSLAEADTLRHEPPPAPRPRKERREEKKPEKSEPSPSLTPPPPVESVMSPEDRRKALENAVSDTTAASQALRRCAGRQLQPDQETVADSVRSFLAQTRAALASGELWRAESLARKARQLANSLNCP